MRFHRLLAASAALLLAAHVTADQESPAQIPADPNNFNGSNDSALVKIWTLSSTCQGLPTVATSVIYDGVTCTPVSAGGVRVLCEIQGNPHGAWALQFFDDVYGGQCLSTPFMQVEATDTFCYQFNINGRLVSAVVDCGGGTQSQLQSVANFQTQADPSLPSGGGGTGAQAKSATIKAQVGNDTSSTGLFTDGIFVSYATGIFMVDKTTSDATSQMAEGDVVKSVLAAMGMTAVGLLL